MTQSTTPVTIILRIPGKWSHPGELIERLPEGCRLTGEALILPDETQVEFCPMAPDDQFAQIFRTSCREPATAEELETVAGYSVNIGLKGPGGSLASARAVMKAGAAIIKAGGAGVFIDNSGLAHGGQQWLAMTEDGSPDALSFAFVTIVGGGEQVWTMGMHVFGLREVVMKRADSDNDEFTIIDVIRYLCTSEVPIENGHLLADLKGPRFQAFTQESPEHLAGSPMHNPFGRLRLVSMREMGERN